MNFSKKVLASILCLCIFMAATTFMVYASASEGAFKVFTQNPGGGETSVEDPGTSTQTSVPSTPSTTPPSREPSSEKPSSPKPKSSNNYLSSLTVVRGTFSPAFNKNVTSYNVVITGGEGTPGVKPAAEDSKATVHKNVPVLPMGGTVTATVVVTAENGETRTYTLNLTRVPAESTDDASNSGEDLTLSGALDVSGEYPSENSWDMSGLFDSEDETNPDVSVEEDQETAGGTNWFLYIGLILILAALGGVGFAVYRQFFAKPKEYDGYDDDYYDDGYGDYGDGDYYEDGGDGYDQPYDEGPYDGEYADSGSVEGEYADGEYVDNAYGNDGYADGDGAGYYDEPTAHIPQPPQQGGQYQGEDYHGQQPPRQGYRRGTNQPQNPRRGGQPDQYRRGGGSQRRNPYHDGGNGGYSNYGDDR